MSPEGTSRPNAPAADPWASPVRRAGLWLGLAGVYFVTGKLGLQLAFVHASATALWPPTGIALAAVLLFGYRVWPGIFLGAVLVNITTAGTWATSIGIGTGNTVEAVVGALLVRRYARGIHAFDQARDFIKFIFLAAVLATAVSPTIGLTSLALGGFAPWSDFGAIWLTWWLGDASGALLFAPVLILWATRPRFPWKSRRAVEAALLLLVLFGTGIFVFGGVGRFSREHYQLGFLTIPPVIWAAFRFGRRGAATTTLFLSLLAAGGTLLGFGPFSRPSPNESLLLLQAFMATIAATSLAVAAIVVERREAEEDRVRALVEAHEAERLKAVSAVKSQFLNMAAHELRTPLAPIRAGLDLVREGSVAGLNDEQRRSLEVVARNVERLAGLVEDMLVAARLDAGRMPLARGAVSLNEIVAEAVDGFRPVARSAELELQVRGGTDLTVDGDPKQLLRVLQNLLSNAIKFTPPGGRVLVETERRDGEGWVRVRDTGVGIAPADMARLFQPFSQLAEGQAKVGGTGLGLYISKSLVELHGGRILCESPGSARGSTFSFSLPLFRP